MAFIRHLLEILYSDVPREELGVIFPHCPLNIRICVFGITTTICLNVLLAITPLPSHIENSRAQH